MKVKRQKQAKKLLSFYRTSFDIKPPYSVLVDGTFCKAALVNKIHIGEQLPKYLDKEITIYTTKCAKKECEGLGPLLYGPLKVLQQFQTLPCGHDRRYKTALKCVRDVAMNGNKFFVASQDEKLQEQIRDIPGIPILFIKFNAIILENPSKASREHSKQASSAKTLPSDREHTVIVEMKKTFLGESEATDTEKKKKRKHSGPNPLSCKKKTVTKPKGVESETKKTHRKRRKIKLPAHVKEHLIKTVS